MGGGQGQIVNPSWRVCTIMNNDFCYNVICNLRNHDLIKKKWTLNLN